MTETKWKYYNHALIPTTAPHEIIEEPTKDIWNKISNGKKALFARWTDDFDCGYETNWWYVIKDDHFDLNSIKAKRRYEIKKGTKNFEVRIIDPTDYVDELYHVEMAAYAEYPETYRPNFSYESFSASINSWKKHEVYGAFYRETDKLVGYAWIDVYDSYIDFCCMKADPKYEKYGINAAIVYFMVERYNNRLSKTFYICDGARSILHKTNFQNYLEKYFGFRKAYCKLKVKYKLWVKIAVKCASPGMIQLIGKFSNSLGEKIKTIKLMDSLTKEIEG